MSLVSDITAQIMESGRARAQGQRQSGAIWGNTLANIWQTIGALPGQIAEAKTREAEGKTRELQNKVVTRELEDKDRARQKQDAIAGIFQKHNGDIDGAIDEIMSVDPEIGMNYHTKQMAAKNGALTYRENQIKAKMADAQYLGQLAGAAKDQATYTAKLYEAGQAGLDVSKAPPNFDDAGPFIDSAKRAALTAQQQLESDQKAIDDARAAAALQERERATRAKEATEAVEKAKADARADEALRISRGHLGVAQQRERREAAGGGDSPLVSIVGPDGKAVLVRRQDAVGKAPASSATDGRPATGAQMKVLGFFNRAKQADDDLQKLETEVSGMGLLSQERMKHATNILQSQTGQSYNQAQRAFTEARLRKDSGAAIPEQEFENDRVTYFAQPGDKKATLDQKRRARAAVLASLGFEAGPALGGFYGEDAPTMIEGYRAVSKGEAAKSSGQPSYTVDANGHIIPLVKK